MTHRIRKLDSVQWTGNRVRLQIVEENHLPPLTAAEWLASIGHPCPPDKTGATRHTWLQNHMRERKAEFESAKAAHVAAHNPERVILAKIEAVFDGRLSLAKRNAVLDFAFLCPPGMLVRFGKKMIPVNRLCRLVSCETVP